MYVWRSVVVVDDSEGCVWLAANLVVTNDCNPLSGILRFLRDRRRSVVPKSDYKRRTSRNCGVRHPRRKRKIGVSRKLPDFALQIDGAIY